MLAAVFIRSWYNPKRDIIGDSKGWAFLAGPTIDAHRMHAAESWPPLQNRFIGVSMFTGKSFAFGALVGAGAVLAFEAAFVSNPATVSARDSAPEAVQPSAGEVAAAAEGKTPPEPYRTTVTELAVAYNANEVQTEAKIAGRPVEVAGFVHSIAKERSDEIVVRFKANDMAYSKAVAFMEPSESATAQALVPGDSAVVLCNRMRLAFDTPTGSGCIFVKVVPAAFGEVQSSTDVQ